MAFIPAPGAIRVVINGSIPNAGPVVNVLHMGNTGGGPENEGPALQALAHAMFASWQATVLTQLHSSYTLEAVTCTDLTVAGAGAYQSDQAPVNGSAQSIYTQVPPVACAMVVLLVAGLSGRGSKGRIYVSGLTTQNLGTGGTVPTQFSTAAQGWLSAWNSAASAAISGTELLLLKKHYRGVSLAGAQLYAITSLQTEVPFRSQRRRQSALD